MFKKLFGGTSSINNDTLDIDAIKQARAKSKTNKEKSNKNYDKEFAKGLIFFKKYTYIPESENLEQAIKYFISAIRLKRHKAKPYFYLAYIASMTEDYEIARKYYEIAEFLNPELNGLTLLKNKIFV